MSPAGREAGLGLGARLYVRHRPERTLLYQIVDEYYPAFKQHRLLLGCKLCAVFQCKRGGTQHLSGSCHAATRTARATRAARAALPASNVTIRTDAS